MKQIDKDRKELQRLVESYGKEDVMKYVNHLDEDYAETPPFILNYAKNIAKFMGGADERQLNYIVRTLQTMANAYYIERGKFVNWMLEDSKNFEHEPAVLDAYKRILNTFAKGVRMPQDPLPEPVARKSQEV